jgi:hypothetical protein
MGAFLLQARLEVPSPSEVGRQRTEPVAGRVGRKWERSGCHGQGSGSKQHATCKGASVGSIEI